MQIPNPGSQVVVTTKYSNPILGGEPFRYFTTKGVVVKAPPWVGAAEFMVATGNPNFPQAVIHTSKVHKLEVLSGSSKVIATSSRVFKVTSKSTGKSYIVTYDQGKVSCTCTGFGYRRTCKHSAKVSTHIKGK